MSVSLRGLVATIALSMGWIPFYTTALSQTLVTLQSDSGEVLKGEIIKHADGLITIKSSIFGEVKVSEDKVKILEDSSTPAKVEHVGTIVPAKAPKVAISSPAASHPAKDQTRNWLHLPKNMEVHAGFGLGFMEGHMTKARNYSGSLEVAYDTERYKSLFDTSFQYGKANNQLITDTHNTSARTYRYFGKTKISPYYAKLKIEHSGDEVHLVDRQTELYTGLGVDLYQSKNISFHVGAGYVSEWEDFAANPAFAVPDPGAIQRNKAYLHETLAINIGSRTQLHHEGYFMVEDIDEREIRLKTGLKYKLTSHLSLDLNHTYTFDDTSPLGIDKDVSQVNLQFGYSL